MKVLVAAVLAVSANVWAGQSATPPPTRPGQGAEPGVARPQPGSRTPPRAAPAKPEAGRGTAALRGQVVAADSGTPIRRAQVRVSGVGLRESRVATTDGQGRFEIRELAGGRYTLTASKGGFVTLQYGQRRPGESGTPLELADAQTLDKLIIGLPRGSVISGRITDEFGEPVVNAGVTAWHYAFVGGTRRLVPAGARDTTDDQGQYRLFGLAPGDYLVSAVLRTREVTDPGDEPSGFAPTYFPGTPNATDAQRVRVALSQEQGGVSFGLMATHLVRVWGQVISATGTPHWGGMVMLTGAGGAGGGRGPAFQQGGSGSRIEGDGSFWIGSVAPGRYQLQARAGDRQNGEFARMDLTVGAEDVGGLMVVTAPAGRIQGAVVTDTGEPLPTEGVQVVARPASPDAQVTGPGGGGGGSARIGADGAFDLGNITDPRFVRATTPSGWTLKAVRVNSADVTDVPLDVAPGQVVTGVEVVITKKLSHAEGTVFDDRKQPVLDATVVVFPADDRLRGYQSRFVRSARPDQQGRFRLSALPPGDYLAIAVQGLEDGQASDPEFLASVQDQAVRVTIEEGETKSVTLGLRR